MDSNFLTDAELPATVADLKNLRKEINFSNSPLTVIRTYEHLGRSIIGDSALVSGALDAYAGTPELGEDFEGLKCLQVNTASYVYSAYFPINPRKLYTCEFVGKTTGSAIFCLVKYDKTKTALFNSGDSWLYVPNNTISNTAFEEKKIIFSATTGTSVNQHNSNCVFAKLAIYGTSGVAQLSKLILREIPLGEPVAYNLPYLPKGQTVYDPTTSKLGYYNGSTIVWSA